MTEGSGWPRPRAETVTALPSLARVFARAAVTGRRSGAGDLPDRTLRIDGLAVERDRLTAYQRLCGYDVGDALPPTYPHVLGFPLQAALMARGDFPLALPGMVHLENRVTAHRALTADEALTLSVHAERLRPHPKGRVVDLVTEAWAAGEPVWRGRSVYLSRGPGTPDASYGDPPPPFPAGEPVALWSLPSGLGRQYAAVSGDVNPIHLHPLTARAMGFPRHIVHGMWTYARVLAALGRAAQEPGTSAVWFTRPVFLPARVALVLGRQDGGAEDVTAGLRSATERDLTHLVLRLRTEGPAAPAR